jgi:hypothetical protein
MSYRVPLATATLPGSVLPGDGLRVIDGVVSTGGAQVEATTPQVTTPADGQAIDIRTEVSIGSLTVNNRDLTLFLA